MWFALPFFLLLWFQPAAPDRALWGVMRQSDPALREVQVLRRTSVSDELDVVIAAGGPRPAFQQKLGLFLQDRGDPGRVYLLDIEKSDTDCVARVERATATDAVLSCAGDGDRRQYWKFIYDVRAKALVWQFHYAPFSAYRVFPNPDGAVFIESDNEKLLAIEYKPDGEPAFRVLSEPAARPWIAKVHTSAGTVGIEQRRVVYIEPDKAPLPAEVPSLPQTTYDQFAAARPERVKQGYVRAGTEVHDSIGPWQREGERIWFAKSFYDGEGSTGVGGFGYFDTTTRKLQVFAPPEIADWSVTAMVVKPDAVWMGITCLGEGINMGGAGVLRFDRATEVTTRLKFPDFANAMAPAGDRILVASDFGIGIVEGGQVRRYFVDRLSDGRYRVVEGE